MAALSLPFGTIVDGKIQQTDIVIAYLKKIIQKAHIQAANVTIAVPMQSVISKKISRTEAAAINQSGQINDYFPGIHDVLAYDYIEIDKDKEVWLIATRHDALMLYLNMIESAGVKVSIVDVDLYALARAAHFALSHKARSYPIFLVELNPLGSQFILLSENNILYQQAMLGGTDQVGAELKAILKIYDSNEQTLESKKVYLLGDMSNASELVEYIYHELSMEAEWINPFDSMIRDSSIHNAVPNNFLVCCGLALRGITSC
jgi:Tfp pilus assembly PilM family ATPase